MRPFSAMVVLLAMCSVAAAGVITFEAKPGGGVPTDGETFSGTYFDGTTGVTFGIDTNGDLVIDTDVYYEKYGAPQGAYQLDDADDSPGGEGGTFFLRPQTTSNPPHAVLEAGEHFLIVYSGDLPTSASGSIWDIDGAEQQTVSALDAGGSVLDSVTLTATEGGNHLPADFSFNSLASPISYIRIGNDAGGPLGFDNFSATRPTNELPPISEPASLGFVGLALAGLVRRRRNG
jgi:MYXO-CTERM domain-containing protein